MNKIPSFLIKILNKILNIVLKSLGIYAGICLIVSVMCLTADVESDMGNSSPHEDAWVYKPPEPIDWRVVKFDFDLKDWNLPVIWASKQ